MSPLTKRSSDPRVPGDVERAFLTVAETAAVLGVSLTTLRGMIKRGEIQARTLGPKTVRVPRAEIDRLADVSSAA